MQTENQLVDPAAVGGAYTSTIFLRTKLQINCIFDPILGFFILITQRLVHTLSV